MPTQASAQQFQICLDRAVRISERLALAIIGAAIFPRYGAADPVAECGFKRGPVCAEPVGPCPILYPVANIGGPQVCYPFASRGGEALPDVTSDMFGVAALIRASRNAAPSSGCIGEGDCPLSPVPCEAVF